MVDSIAFILIIALLFLSIIIHEYAHGLIADRLGDPSPRAAGRLTFNPMAHIDPFGTIILPLTILLAGRGAIPPVGYARPVPINPLNFAIPRDGMMWVGLAGPLSNLALALVLGLVRPLVTLAGMTFFSEILAYGILINVTLGVFNLLPIPPLDGSRVVAALIPHKYAYHYLKVEKYGFFILMVLFFTKILQRILFPLVNLMSAVLRIDIHV